MPARKFKEKEGLEAVPKYNQPTKLDHSPTAK